MTSELARTIYSHFCLDAAEPGLWRITAPGQPGLLAYMRHVRSAPVLAPGTGAAAEFATFDRLTIDWSPESGAAATLGSDGRSLTVRARAMTLHEPHKTLYELLPLAALDRTARRFWWRVFWVVQWPGGGRLLGLIVRRR